MRVLPWLSDVGGSEGASGDLWLMALHASTLSALLLRLWWDYANTQTFPSTWRQDLETPGRESLTQRAYQGKLVNSQKTNGENFCFSYLSAELQFKVTRKAIPEGPSTTSLMTPISHCTLADLTLHRHTDTSQRSAAAASSHPLTPLHPRTQARSSIRPPVSNTCSDRV